MKRFKIGDLVILSVALHSTQIQFLNQECEVTQDWPMVYDNGSGIRDYQVHFGGGWIADVYDWQLRPKDAYDVDMSERREECEA